MYTIWGRVGFLCVVACARCLPLLDLSSDDVALPSPCLVSTLEISVRRYVVTTRLTEVRWGLRRRRSQLAVFTLTLYSFTLYSLPRRNRCTRACEPATPPAGTPPSAAASTRTGPAASGGGAHAGSDGCGSGCGGGSATSSPGSKLPPMPRVRRQRWPVSALRSAARAARRAPSEGQRASAEGLRAVHRLLRAVRARGRCVAMPAPRRAPSAATPRGAVG